MFSVCCLAIGHFVGHVPQVARTHHRTVPSFCGEGHFEPSLLLFLLFFSSNSSFCYTIAIAVSFRIVTTAALSTETRFSCCLILCLKSTTASHQCLSRLSFVLCSCNFVKLGECHSHRPCLCPPLTVRFETSPRTLLSSQLKWRSSARR